MDQTSEMILTVQNTIQEMIAGIKAIRIVLYNQSITTPEEIGKLQSEIREAMAQTPRGKVFETLLAQISDTRRQL